MTSDRVVLIPAYQPENCMIELIQKIRAGGFKIVVVDDGSSKEKKPIFRQIEQDATVLKHEINQGKGRALKTGMSYIQNHFPQKSIIVTVDADGQHKTEDVIRICQKAERNSGCLILGSRGMKDNVPFPSRFGNFITRFVYWFATGVKVHDTQTGLRAFDSDLLSKLLKIQGERYEYEMNVLLECAAKKIPIKEVEIETVYIDDNASSHFDKVKDSWRIYKEILKFSASSLISFLIDFGMYGLLSVLTAGIGDLSLVISNIGARLISGTVNYTVNRKLVFKSEESKWKSVIGYVTLAGGILLCNTLILEILVANLGVNRYLGKIAVEILLFFLSWFIQHHLIFRKREVK